MFERLYGPYETRGRFHVHAYHLDGTKKYHAFETEEEARDFLKNNKRRLIANPVKVKGAIDDYLAQRTDIKESTRTTLRFRLEALARGNEAAYLATFPAMKAWEDLTKTNSVDTLYGIRSAGNGFFDWCVGRQYLKKNPFKGIKIVGKKREGKEQLRMDEARLFLERALEIADGASLDGRPTSQQRMAVLGAASALLLGFRNGEVVARTVRDLDDDGHVLWVQDAKTRAGTRRVEIPDALRTYLVKLAEGRDRTAQLFDGLTREGLRYWTRKLCRDLGLPRVTPHGLRGTHATASMRPHANPHEVAAALGHASFAVTERHYAKREAITSARQEAAVDSLLASKSSSKTFGHEVVFDATTPKPPRNQSNLQPDFCARRGTRTPMAVNR